MDINLLKGNCYYINLDESKDRRRNFENSVKNFTFSKFKRVPAVKGYKIPTPFGYASRPAVYGNYLSHLRLYENLLQNDSQCAWICEDDCVFVDNFELNLQAYLAHVPDDADLIYVGGDVKYRNEFPPIQLNSYVVKPFFVNTTMSYIIANRTTLELLYRYWTDYEYILSLPLDKRGEACFGDQMIRRMCQEDVVNVYCPLHMLAGQGNYESIVWPTESNEDYFDYPLYTKYTPITDNVRVFTCYSSNHSIGLNGKKDNKVQCKNKLPGHIIFAHADSRIVLQCDKSIKLAGYLDNEPDGFLECGDDIEFKVNSRLIGKVRTCYDQTDLVTLKPGLYALTTKTTNQNRAHSAWLIQELEN